MFGINLFLTGMSSTVDIPKKTKAAATMYSPRTPINSSSLPSYESRTYDEVELWRVNFFLKYFRVPWFRDYVLC